MTRQVLLEFAFAIVSTIGCAVEVRQGEGEAMPAGGEPAAPASAEVEPVDLFAGDLPDLILSAHARQLAGAVLDVTTLRALHDYATRYETDARAWLLLARDSMLREWEPLALRQYRSAIEADVRAVHQDGVLEDLVHIAAAYGGTEHREASALIADAYADEALAAIEHELELARGQGELEAVARMETLRDGVMGGRSR